MSAYTLTFGESMRDKGSRLIPSPFTDLVEQATSELLLVPDYDKIILLCEHANAKPDQVIDLVRAVRRRIDHRSPKVQYFTVCLLEGLVKNCGPHVHTEIVDTKGMLHDLVSIATRELIRDGEREARVAALKLILNMSLWFPEHPNEKLRALATLAEGVYAGGGTFEGIEPDLSVQINTQALSRASLASRAAQQQQRRARVRHATVHNRAAEEHRQRHAQGHAATVVEAIPIIPPSEAEIEGMFEGAILLGECLRLAEENQTSVRHDDVVRNVSQTVKQSSEQLRTVVASGADLPNMELLLSLYDSQEAVLTQLSQLERKEHESEMLQQQQQRAPPATGGATATTNAEGSRYTALPVHSPSGRIASAQDTEDQAHYHMPQQHYGVAPSSSSAQATATSTIPQMQMEQQQEEPSPSRRAPPPYEDNFRAAGGAAAAASSAPPPPPQQQQQQQAPRQAPDIDDLFTGYVPPPIQSPPQQEQQQQQESPLRSAQDVGGEEMKDFTPDGQPAQQQEQNGASDDATKEAEKASPAPAHTAFPAPSQQLDPKQNEEASQEMKDFSKNDDPAAASDDHPMPSHGAHHGSLNNDEDEFEMFLNDRIGNKK